MAGDVVGTPTYMSPEQCTGGALGPTSDIYALGCVMYEVFAGRPPFTADSYCEMVRQHLADMPSRLPFVQPSTSISPVLEAIIFKTMAKEPGQRYQSTAQIKRELQAIASSD